MEEQIQPSIQNLKPATKSQGPVTWSIRAVERDTRSVIEKAAERAGKTIGQYINEDVRSFAQGQLTQNQLPAAPVDIQNQINHLTTIIESIANRMPEQGKNPFGNVYSTNQDRILYFTNNRDRCAMVC